MTVLVTGVAGFIGFHLAKRLLLSDVPVVGLDNLNSYYDVSLKVDRLNYLKKNASSKDLAFQFYNNNIQDHSSIQQIFCQHTISSVVNLAAQAGVRYSIENPSTYIQSNLVGFGNILELCRHYSVDQLIYASSSSVYGGNTVLPFSEKHNVDHPLSLYAASKKANELMAHSYSHLFNLPTTGLRFFTVYGPWGRPDMALFLFTKSILSNKPIQLFNNGQMVRDFTYIDDIVESIVRLLAKPPLPNPGYSSSELGPSSSWAPYSIFNIGNSNPIPLLDYVEALEKSLGIKALKEYLPMQMGDVPMTAADTTAIEKWIGFKPSTSVDEGVQHFVSWYRDYYQL